MLGYGGVNSFFTYFVVFAIESDENQNLTRLSPKAGTSRTIMRA